MNGYQKLRLAQRRGSMFIYAVVALVVMFAICSLAVDWGRVQVVKAELKNAADAVVLYAVSGLQDNTAITKALAAASENSADGSPLSILTSDVETGKWNTSSRTFTSGGTPVDAVRVTIHRTAARGNPVPLTFAAMLGLSSCDVQATAIGLAAGLDPNFVGLQKFETKNNTSAGYNPSLGAPGVSNVSNSIVLATNGTMSFDNNSSINGRVALGPSGTYSLQTPTPTHLSTNLTYPAVTSAPVGSSGALSVSGTQTLAGGTYYYSSISMANNSILRFSGPTSLYVQSNVAFTGSASIYATSQIPADLKIYVIGSATSYFGGANSNTVNIYARIYAPNTDFIAKNNAQLRGSAIFRSIDVKNNLTLYHDQTGGFGSQNTSVALVE